MDFSEAAERISRKFSQKGTEVDPKKIEGKLRRLVTEFGVQPSEAERSVNNELAKEYNLPAMGTGGGGKNSGAAELKKIADEALQRAATVESVLVVKRTGHEINMEFGRDMWYHELVSLPIAGNACDIEMMDAEDPLYVLYTSGTTGKPKAIMHTHGGYMVGTYTTLKYVFDIHEEDRFWCAADPGWVTGHSYVCG